MQRFSAEPVDTAQVDLLVQRARRERSEYIHGLFVRAARAVRARLARSRATDREHGFHGRPHTA